MNKLFHLSLFLLVILNSASSLAADIDTSKLIKVTPANNSKCVEYYSHNDGLYCSTVSLQSQSIDPTLLQHEKLKIMFDDRYWQAAWGKNNSRITTIEYIPSGDDINHWNELITSQFFPGLQEKVTPKQFAEYFLRDLKKSGYKPIVSFLENTNNRVIFEFRLEQPSNQIQDELQMVTTDNQGLYVLHYAIKKADMGQQNREKWLQNLQRSSIKN